MGYLFITLGLGILAGLYIMLRNYIERPTNNSGQTGDGYISGGGRENHPRWPEENERLSHQMRRWWEL